MGEAVFMSAVLAMRLCGKVSDMVCEAVNQENGRPNTVLRPILAEMLVALSDHCQTWPTVRLGLETAAEAIHSVVGVQAVDSFFKFVSEEWLPAMRAFVCAGVERLLTSQTNTLTKQTPQWLHLASTNYNTSLLKKTLLQPRMQDALAAEVEEAFALTASYAELRARIFRGDHGGNANLTIEAAEAALDHARLTLTAAAAVNLIENLGRSSGAVAQAKALLIHRALPETIRGRLRNIAEANV